ncbi:hypothetical protein BU16DRAFT_247291 [Lophium mytilinum]|uniref:RING-type domain-containing protein n=1 Tax=Lophium mytilinum TaxID=390894 RepID=A0A6A6R6Q7_9PEZI|nr:hypothetical protein BU16DRAFT_247291 [Lophium mytilinum]
MCKLRPPYVSEFLPKPMWEIGQMLRRQLNRGVQTLINCYTQTDTYERVGANMQVSTVSKPYGGGPEDCCICFESTGAPDAVVIGCGLFFHVCCLGQMINGVTDSTNLCPFVGSSFASAGLVGPAQPNMTTTNTPRLLACIAYGSLGKTSIVSGNCTSKSLEVLHTVSGWRMRIRRAVLGKLGGRTLNPNPRTTPRPTSKTIRQHWRIPPNLRTTLWLTSMAIGANWRIKETKTTAKAHNFRIEGIRKLLASLRRALD